MRILIFFYFSTFIFKDKHVLVEPHNPLEKIKIKEVKEEVDGINIDGIGNLEDLPGIVFIHGECGNLKVFVDGGELSRNINTDR